MKDIILDFDSIIDSRLDWLWSPSDSFIICFCGPDGNVPIILILRGSLSNDDGDVNKNGKKAIGRRHLPSLYDYDVKMPNFTFCRGHEHKTTTFFFFSWTSIPSFRIQLQKKCQHLTNWTSWKKRDKVWSRATSLFQCRFRSRRSRCCLSFHLLGSLAAAWKMGYMKASSHHRIFAIRNGSECVEDYLENHLLGAFISKSMKIKPVVQGKKFFCFLPSLLSLFLYLCDFAKKNPGGLPSCWEPRPRPIRGWVASLFCVKTRGVGRGDFVTLIRVLCQKAVQSQRIFPVA